MGFITSNKSSQCAIKASPRSKTSSRNCNPSNQSKDALRGRCQKEGQGLVPTKKAAAVSCDSQIEDIDLEKQLKLAGGMSDESDCMWLSSECNFLSLLASDGSGDVWELNSWNGSPHDRQSESSASDVARVSSVDDPPLDMEFSKEECSLENSPACWCESSGSCYRALKKNSSTYWTSCSSLAAIDDSACSIWESDRTGIWISSLDLNLQCYELPEPKEDGFNISYSDFSSSSNSSMGASRSEFSLSSSSSATSFDLTESSRSSVEYDEPLFWPYHQDLYKLPELDKSCLCVSPRKDGMMVNNEGMNELKSVEVKLRKTNSLPASRKRMQQRCGRRPEFSQTPKEPAMGRKTQVSTGRSIRKSSLSQPQMSISLAQVSTNEINSYTKKETHQLKCKSQRHMWEELPEKPLPEFEASHLQEFLLGVTIEKLIGLNEFDGHEGLILDFNEDFHLSL